MTIERCDSAGILEFKRGWTYLGRSAALVICFLWSMALVVRLIPQPNALHDFVQEWASGRNYLHGYPIYEPLAEAVPRHISGRYFGTVQINAHPPASVLVSLPFAPPEYATAFLAWGLTSLMALGISLWLMMRSRGLGYSAWALLPIGSLLLTSNSLAQQVNQGQWNLFLLLMIVGVWYAERHDRALLAGLLIGLAAAIKIFPAYLGLYLLMRRRWDGVVGCAVGFLLANLITLVVLGGACYVDYVQRVLPEVGTFRDWWPNASVAGYFDKLLHAPSGHVQPLWFAPQLAKIGFVLSFVVITSLAGWKCWTATSRHEQDQAFSVCVIAMLLLSPITWDHYFLLLLLPLLVMWRGLPPSFGNRTLLVVTAIGLMVINPKWIWDATIPGHGELPRDPTLPPSVATAWQTVTVISYQFYLLLALFAFAMIAKPRRANAISGDESTEACPSETS